MALRRSPKSFLLNGIWWFVRSWSSFFMYLRTYSTTVQYSTVQFCCTYMCSKQEHKADHGHKKGHSPRAQEGHSSTGISRPRTEVLRTRAYFSAANTLLRSRASRGHLNLYPCDFTITLLRKFHFWSELPCSLFFVYYFLLFVSHCSQLPTARSYLRSWVAY